jgi:hypothetical protein
VTPSVLRLVRERIGVRRIKESNDPFFNDISLKMWDDLEGLNYTARDAVMLRDAEEGWRMSTSYCILKGAARLIKKKELEKCLTS